MFIFRSLSHKPIPTTLFKPLQSSFSTKNTPVAMASPPPQKGSHATSGAHQKKRLILCCDGTWVDSDNGYDEKKHALAVPSNVTRFCRSLRTEAWKPGAQNIPQISYYQAGVGTGHDIIDQLGGGAAGEGIDEHIREAYSFVARNWIGGSGGDPDLDDELYLVGFSRGAFTARSIVGFISTVGLLTKRGMDYFPEIFKDYENMNNQAFENPLHGLGTKKPRLDGGDQKSQKAYFEFLLNQPEPLTSARIPTINALGVWDTVGSLGVPGIAVVDEIKSFMNLPVYRKELQFYDTSLAENVQYAFQALALDEMRHPFTPCLWEKPHNKVTKVKQVWFPGVHSNVGGGMDDIELSDITLAWMLSQFSPFLDFDEDYIKKTFELNKKRGSQRPYACGNIKTKDLNPIYKISGFRVRTPGQYRRANHTTGEETEESLINTRERIHPSVRIRLASKALGNFGIDDKGPYLADALTPEDSQLWSDILGRHHVLRHGWKLVKNDDAKPIEWANDFAGNEYFPTEQKAPPFYWKCQHPDKTSPDVMVEEPQGTWEKRLWETQNPLPKFPELVAKEWLFPSDKSG